MALNHISAEHYSKYSRPVQKWTRTAIQECLGSQSRTYSRVLDLGCGTGENTQYLSDFVGADDVTGIDINSSFIEHAKNYCDNSVIRIKQSDLNKNQWTKFANEDKYDLVFSSFFVHWNSNTKSFLKNIIDCLKPGGESFHVFGIKPCEAFMITMKTLLYDPKWDSYLENFRKAPEWMARDKQVNLWAGFNDPAAAFEELLVSSGHQVLQCHTKQVTYTTESRDESKGMLQWLLPLVKFIPANRIDEFMEDALNIYYKYADKSCIKDGDVTNEHHIWSTKVLIVHTRCPSEEDACILQSTSSASEHSSIYQTNQSSSSSTSLSYNSMSTSSSSNSIL